MLEESLLSLLLLLRLLVLGEVIGFRSLLQSLLVHTLEVDLCAGGDHITGVHSSERDTIDFERAGDKEDTLGEVLEEDDTLTTETSSEEDEDGSGLEAGPKLGWVVCLAGLEKIIVSLYVVAKIVCVCITQGAYLSNRRLDLESNISRVTQHRAHKCKAAHTAKKASILTFLGWLSSSMGYHFWALSAGTVRWPFPNFFVSDVADMLATLTKCWRRKWKMEIPSCRR